MRAIAEEYNATLGLHHNQDIPSLFPVDEATQTAKLFEAPDGIIREYYSLADFPDTVEIPLLDYDNQARLTIGSPIAFVKEPAPELQPLLSKGAIADIYAFFGTPFHFVLFESGSILTLRSSDYDYVRYIGCWEDLRQAVDSMTDIKDFSLFKEGNAFVAVGVLPDGSLDIRLVASRRGKTSSTYPLVEALKG